MKVNRGSPQLPVLATCVTVLSVSLPKPGFHGRKIRVAGRMLSYEPSTALALLQDHDAALLVDISLCVDHTSEWPRESGAIVVVVGDLEYMDVCACIVFFCKQITKLLEQDTLPIPVLPLYASPPVHIDPRVVLRALFVVPKHGLDLHLWHEMVAKLQVPWRLPAESGTDDPSTSE
jgi:hypothetical protein